MTLGLAVSGAAIGSLIGLPLPMLLGPMLLVATAAAGGLQIKGHALGMPKGWRQVLIPVLGLAIGCSVPQGILSQMLMWWPTVLAVVAFVPLAHGASFWVYRRLGRLDPITAYFAAMPGGFIEAMEMGEAHRAEVPMLAMLQFLRLILCMLLIPFSFAILTGHAVGSGAGVVLPGAENPLHLQDIALLLGAAVIGAWAADLLKIPAANLLGPLIASGVVHALGWTQAAPPSWLIMITQVVVGATLGGQFAGMDMRRLWLAMRLSLMAMAGSLLLALGIALPLAGLVEQPVPSLVLAFAPGGVSEMALVAISLQLSAIFVTLHHFVRIILAVLVSRLGLIWLLKVHGAPK